MVVLFFHVEAAGNISDSDRTLLVEMFDKAKLPHIVHETHLYMTADADKDQGMVQHILKDVAGYVRGTGRWSPADRCCSCGAQIDPTKCSPEDADCPLCENVMRYFLQPGLSDEQKSEREYYEGMGLTTDGNCKIKRLRGWSDGCGAQFLCFAFLLFISMFFVLCRLYLDWCWFCSCHGKTVENDGDGGSVKKSLSDYEGRDDPTKDASTALPDARAVVTFGRRHLGTLSKTLVQKKGKGVFRRWFHHIPGRGHGAIQRHLVHKALDGGARYLTASGKCLAEKLKIRKVRRVVSQGFTSRLLASARPCCDSTKCSACTGDPVNRDPRKCKRSEFTTCREIQIAPRTSHAAASTRGALAIEGASLGSSAFAEEVMATETDSDESKFWLIVVDGPSEVVPKDYVCPDLGCEVKFDYSRGKKAVKARRFRPVVSGNGDASTRRFQEDVSLGAFFVPCHLLRMGKIKLADEKSDIEPKVRLLSATDKATVLEECRVTD